MTQSNNIHQTKLIIPKNLNEHQDVFKLDTIAPEILADQLCFYTFTLFKDIPAIEYLNFIWRDSNEKVGSPHLEYLSARFDKV